MWALMSPSADTSGTSVMTMVHLDLVSRWRCLPRPSRIFFGRGHPLVGQELVLRHRGTPWSSSDGRRELRAAVEQSSARSVRGLAEARAISSAAASERTTRRPTKAASPSTSTSRRPVRCQWANQPTRRQRRVGEQHGVLVADEPGVDAGPHDALACRRRGPRCPCADVLDELPVDVLDGDEGEGLGVGGHEPNRRLGALAERTSGSASGSIASRLRPAQAEPQLGGEVAEDLLLVLEVPVEEPLRDARLAADVDDPRSGRSPARRTGAAAASRSCCLRSDPWAVSRRSGRARWQPSSHLTRGSMSPSSARTRRWGGAPEAERLDEPGAEPEVEEPAAADRHVDLHQLRHVHPPLPTAVRGDLQPRDGRDHHPGAVLGLRQVPRPRCPVDCIYPDPDWKPAPEDWWEEPANDDPYR